MFDNVPEKLELGVRGLKARFAPGDDTKYAYAGLFVSIEYIGLDLRNKATLSFLKVPLSGQMSYETFTRLMLLGESLFILRSCDAFADICRRLEESINSAFFELLAARLFFEGGFKIDVRHEAGKKKGENFDFFGIRNGERINGEVTALTRKNFNTKTALRALYEKMSQLPRTFPSVVFCVLPESWMYPPQFIQPRLNYLGSTFLRNTRRVNAVVFQAEMPMSWPGTRGGGSVPIGQFNYFNHAPYHPIRDLDFLQRERVTPEMRAALKGEAPVSILKKLRDNEFYHWVDSLVP